MKISIIRTLRVALALAVTLLVIAYAGAETCKAPDAAKRSQVEGYVIARYKMPSAADVILTDSKQANDACFWLLKYESSNPKREITVYLSPDGNYLTQALDDVRIDPAAAEAATRAQNLKALLESTTPEIGDKNAAITVVEFADFECPYCKRMADVLEKEFLPTEGTKVRFLFKNFPLPMHPWAMAAAEMADCVTLQKPSEFWKVHDFLFDNQTQLTAGNIKEKVTAFVAANVAIDQTQYRSCVDSDLAMGPVKKDVDLGQKLGVRGTPAIFVNGDLYPGFKDADQLRGLIGGNQKGDPRLSTAPQVAAPVAASSRSTLPSPSTCAPRAQ